MLVYHRSIKNTCWGRHTSVGLPELLHAMPHQHDARQLCKRLDDVKLKRGLTSKNVCRSFLRTPVPVLWGPVAWTPGAAGYPQEYGGRYTRCVLRKDKETRKWVTKGDGRTREMRTRRYTVLSGWVNLKQCHSWPVSLFIQWGLSYLCLSRVHREKSTHPSLELYWAAASGFNKNHSQGSLNLESQIMIRKTCHISY